MAAASDPGHLQGEASQGWNQASAAQWLGRTQLSAPEKGHLSSLRPLVNITTGTQIQFGPTPSRSANTDGKKQNEELDD